MNVQPSHDSSYSTDAPTGMTNVPPPSLNQPENRGRRRKSFARFVFVVTGLAVCTLGALLYQSQGRERAMQLSLAELRSERDAAVESRHQTEATLDATRRAKSALEQQLARASAALTATESALGASARSGDTLAARVEELVQRLDASERARRTAEYERAQLNGELVVARGELDDRADEIRKCVSAALALRSKLEDASSAIRIGTVGLREIPREGIHFSMRSGLAGEYEKVVDEYNDLVGRFNAAIDRCNGLQDILNSVIRALRG